jgi:MFS family permease
MLTALTNRQYRYLWGGQATSHLRDQFHLVALPWLVLAVTHDPLQLGLVLAVAGIPRAALMLFGGAVADRISPRLVMLVSDLLRFLITGTLVLATFTAQVQIWMIYGSWGPRSPARSSPSSPEPDRRRATWKASVSLSPSTLPRLPSRPSACG